MPCAQNARFAISRRHLLIGGTSAALLSACGEPRQAAFQSTPGMPSLRLIGETTLAHRLAFKGTTVGGLSGLDYDAGQDLWVAISDDRSEHQPARFYTLRLAISAQGLAAPELVDTVPLRQPDGRTYPSRRQNPRAEVPDPEAIRWRPQTQTLLWTSEGDVRRGGDPALFEMAADGRELRRFALPAHFRADPSGQSGPRDNLAFEGLTLTPDGSAAWVAMENALVQDGPEPSVGAPGGPCRVTRFDLATGQATAQRAYVPDAIPQAPAPAIGFADNGVSEILAVDADRLLVLERAYMMGVGNSLRLYLVDTRQGSDTLTEARLMPPSPATNWSPMPKTLLADFSAFVGPQPDGRPGLRRLDNTEGMAWGPRLTGANGQPGHRTLVFVSDDNFNPAQTTQLIAFEFLETTP
ncbi:hypothetical protein RD110_02265 [Rhodoferax koreense]|uniref:Phytase-like domain-containing protein n=1 Tax=Rhodoferax koreensis TaxID=1842727 RepID=A0A1P8JR09_9BURK|nr:esterase-like activity of phytase family protein [Rhodoferax koreense]APW36180.1 hypothetical protein RD110_02265 [Rhodoferax koreense]